LSQEFGSVYTNDSYKLSFQAKAITNKTIVVELEESHSPFRVLASRNFEITSTAQTYVWSELVPMIDNNEARVVFHLGSDSAEVWLDKVMLQPENCADVAVGYKWEFREGDPEGLWSEWKEIIGANLSTYDPPVQNTVRQYRRLTGIAGSDAYKASEHITIGLCQTSATEDVAFEGAIYPNPTAGNLTIESKNILQVSLSDFTGRSLLSTDLVQGKNELNLNHLETGVYYLMLRDGKNSWMKKILISSN